MHLLYTRAEMRTRRAAGLATVGCALHGVSRVAGRRCAHLAPFSMLFYSILFYPLLFYPLLFYLLVEAPPLRTMTKSQRSNSVAQ